MGNAIRQRLKQSHFENEALEAFLNVLVTANHLRQYLTPVCASFGITHAQYNVLRILKGVYPQGHPRSEIICRMIEQAPDVTRLIDRLEKQELVERIRSDKDKRLSIARITKKGLDLLEKMNPYVKRANGMIETKLTEDECRELSRLCEKIYAGNS
jgi:DNA-binding MarR family transcriptional regulator